VLLAEVITNTVEPTLTLADTLPVAILERFKPTILLAEILVSPLPFPKKDPLKEPNPTPIKEPLRDPVKEPDKGNFSCLLKNCAIIN
jgi:hypothetical protein